MKVKIIVLALILLTTAVYAQKTKKVINRDGSFSLTETYYVLKSDQQTKHGSYKKMPWKSGGGGNDHATTINQARLFTHSIAPHNSCPYRCYQLQHYDY